MTLAITIIVMAPFATVGVLLAFNIRGLADKFAAKTRRDWAIEGRARSSVLLARTIGVVFLVASLLVISLEVRGLITSYFALKK